MITERVFKSQAKYKGSLRSRVGGETGEGSGATPPTRLKASNRFEAEMEEVERNK